MKVIRDYLTSQEIDYIVKAMMEKETAIEREVVKVGLVAQLVIEDLGKYDTCDEIYDIIVANDKINFSAIINNYDIIDKIYSEETGINKILKDFVDNINKKIDEMGEIDLNNAIMQLKEIADNRGDGIDGNNKSFQKSPRNRKKS